MGWNSRVQLLAAEYECTSDQETNPDGSGFLIMKKCARNPHVTNFLRLLDSQRQQGTPLFRRSKRRHELPRVPAPDNRESLISERLPRTCPLDWFDPDYFNSMNIEFRALYRDSPIALPLPHDCVQDDFNPDWKRMSERAFMAKYGSRVRAQYNLPTDEELNQGDADADDEEEEIEEDLIHIYDQDNNMGGQP